MITGQTFPQGMPYAIMIVGIGETADGAINLMRMDGITGAGILALNENDPAGPEAKVRQEINGNQGYAKMAIIMFGPWNSSAVQTATACAIQIKEYGILTIGITTNKLNPDGGIGRKQDNDSWKTLSEAVDLLITLSPDQPGMGLATQAIPTGFTMADLMMVRTIKTLTEPFTLPGYVCFSISEIADMSRRCVYGLFITGEALGEQNALLALDQVLNSPLLTAENKKRTSHLILHIVFGPDLLIDTISKMLDQVDSAFGTLAEILWQCQPAAIGEMFRVSMIIAGQEEFTR